MVVNGWDQSSVSCTKFMSSISGTLGHFLFRQSKTFHCLNLDILSLCYIINKAHKKQAWFCAFNHLCTGNVLKRNYSLCLAWGYLTAAVIIHQQNAPLYVQKQFADTRNLQRLDSRTYSIWETPRTFDTSTSSTHTHKHIRGLIWTLVTVSYHSAAC